MDRIDLHITVSNVNYDDLSSDKLAEPSSAVRERVNKARQVQLKRFEGTGIFSNSKMSSEMLKQYCVLDAESEKIIKDAFDKLNLSARGYTRILKVARTIADILVFFSCAISFILWASKRL